MRNVFGLVGLVTIGAAVCGAEDAASPSPYAIVETYGQELVVKAANGAAEIATPEVAPVFDNHNWAMSTRWDDSNPNALNIRKKMLANGIHGTFYLNSKRPEKNAKTSLACKLTGTGECSVGGHSVNHPKLPALPANEAFRELMANRITLEVLTDRPVNSLAFPYGQYQAKGRPEVKKAITEAVLRTGYHHCVYKGFVVSNPNLPPGLVSTGHQVVPGDRQVNAEKFWASIEKVRKNETNYRKQSDEIFLGVHPWQKGQALEDLATVMSKLRDWDDFWHCNQTEFAAYVKQRRNTTIKPLGNGRFDIRRPCAYDVGNDIALTLVFDGAIQSATIDGKDCPVRQAGDKTIVNVPHNAAHGLPVLIDEAVSGISAKFEGLKTSVTMDDEKNEVCYMLTNESGMPLTDAVLTISVPPAFQPGMLRRKRRELANSATWTVALPVTSEEEADYWCNGSRYVAAQLDFVQNGTRGRLFTTTSMPPVVAAK